MCKMTSLACLAVLAGCCYVVGSTGCTDDFITSENTQAIGGIVMSNIEMPLSECLHTCKQLARCAAVDYNNGTCWIHLNKEASIKTKPLHGVDHYALDRCPGAKDCYQTYHEQENTKAENGIPQKPTTLEKCREACYIVLDCIAYQYNNGTQDCWIHIDRDDMNTKSALQGVDLYERLAINSCDIVTTSTDSTTKKRDDNSNAPSTSGSGESSTLVYSLANDAGTTRVTSASPTTILSSLSLVVCVSAIAMIIKKL